MAASVGAIGSLRTPFGVRGYGSEAFRYRAFMSASIIAAICSPRRTL